MAITRAFRATPELGPSISESSTHYWFDPENIDVSYRLGNKEVGTDGHEYIMVKAHAALTVGLRFDVTDVTFLTATNASGAYMVSSEMRGGTVPINAYFQAKKFAL